MKLIKRTDYPDLIKLSDMMNIVKESLSGDIGNCKDERLKYSMEMRKWIVGLFAHGCREVGKQIIGEEIITYNDLYSCIDSLKEMISSDERRIQYSNQYFNEQLGLDKVRLFKCPKCNKVCSVSCANLYGIEITSINGTCKQCKCKIQEVKNAT